MKKILLTALIIGVFLMNASEVFAATTLYEVSDAHAVSSIYGGNSGTVTDLIAQKYIAPADQSLCAVDFKVARTSASITKPSLRLKIRSGGSNPENGNELASVTVAASALPTILGSYTTFTLPTCVPLFAGTTYWFTFENYEPIFTISFGYYRSMYRATDQFSYSSMWIKNCSACVPGFTWIENVNAEWAIKLIGPDSLPAKEPVIIVPGILGSALGSENELLWPNLARIALDINDEFLSSGLALASDGTSVNQITVGEIIDSMGTVDIFNSLKDELRADGYVDNVSLFSLPYDWRMDLKVTKDVLRQKVDEVKAATGFDKVTIVTHSMGGLLTKGYIQAYGKESIDKLIFVGTPHLGAPKAAKALLVGDRFGVPFLEEDAMKAISLNAAAVYDLLPVKEYFSQFIGYLKKQNNSEPFDYEETKNFLITQGMNWNLLDAAEAFSESNLPDLDFSGIDTYNIAGCRTSTQAGYVYNALDHEIEDIKYASGDKTVPLPSADYINIPTAHKYYFKNAVHTHLPSQPSIRSAIVNILNDTPVTVTDDLASDNLFCQFTGKEMLWRSPVDVHVYDQFGNHTGPAANNSIDYGIPGVEYDVIGHQKFVFLPTDTGATYTVIGKGTDNGSFDMIIRDNDNGNTTDTAFFNDVSITNQSKISFDVLSDTDTVSITVDQNGDGQLSTISTVTPQSLIADIERSFQSGWILKTGVKNDLVKKVKLAIRLENNLVNLREKLPGKPKIVRKIEKVEERIDKVLGKQFVKELEIAHEKGRMTDQAYQLLREDIDWLLKN